ncbi:MULTISPECIES: hypothetical protein [Amycolatopsis]|uniref:Uncharacterized protein n=1 Tax=Amycolatopsis dongchuanensis TaxID=1070866 RepID=A0ABP8VEE8_9PSEU|nr:hypothetical protein [Amycolatopsis sacchari]
MRGATIRKRAYYRCTSRTMAPGALKLADHPKTVNLREGVVVEALNGRLRELFHPDNPDQTAAALLGSEGSQAGGGSLEAARNRPADAEARLRRYQAAIAAGVEPEALVDPINQAQAERAAAKAPIESVPADSTVSRAEIREDRCTRRRLRHPGPRNHGRPEPPVPSAKPGATLRTKRAGRLCDDQPGCR